MKQQIRQRFERAGTYATYARAQAQIATALWGLFMGRLGNVDATQSTVGYGLYLGNEAHFGDALDPAAFRRACCKMRVLELGAGRGALTQHLAPYVNTHYPKAHIALNDLFDVGQLRGLFGGMPVHLHQGDAETLIAKTHPLSLLAAASVVQWFDAPLRIVNTPLQEGGAVLFSTFLEGHFWQLKYTTGQGLVYPTQDAWYKALTTAHIGGTSVIWVDTLYFAHPFDVLRHIRQTGVSLGGRVNTKAFLRAYEALQTPKGYGLTYRALLILGQKKTP